ncbi:MAG TPA: shikimate kinase [Pirellulales bacterium]|nr:shikimate kinase [Pirellulales bacterium]
MPTPENLVLIGYRGTGKTTVAQQLALRLGWDWCDSDVEVELRAGKSIAAQFADEGELAFRDRESQVIAALVARERTIVAAGGGVVLRPENRRALAAAGAVVWLTAQVETIAARIAADATTAARRPNLLAGGEQEIRQLLAQRTPLYEEAATITVATDDREPGDIAGEIIDRLQLASCGSEGG